MFQYQIQTIKPLTTAHLAQTMTLLGMTGAELKQRIESELAKNPALEVSEDRFCPTCHRPIVDTGPCPICSRPKHDDLDEPIVFVSSQSDYIASERNTIDNYMLDDLPDDNLTPTVDLATHVLRQVATELQQDESLIAAHILTSLDDDGFLTVPPFEISHYHHVPLEVVEKVIRLIQKADPIGVGSANPKEAMLIQLEILVENQYNVPRIAETLIDEGLYLLSRHQHAELAKQLRISKEEVRAAADFISKNLNPYPGRSYWGDHRQEPGINPQSYQQPDIIIKKMNQQTGNHLVVEILLPLRGTLQINPLFRQATKDATQENADQWRKDLENANLLIKCIQQRNHTMQRLMKYIASEQNAFILEGEKFLQPITRAKVADRLEVHESTISRAVSGKCVQLPTGKIIPLSMFFDRSLPIRARIREMIQNEKQVYTDAQLVELLSQNGIEIARRTAAKYRSMEGILPAHLRKKMKNRANNNGKNYTRSIS